MIRLGPPGWHMPTKPLPAWAMAIGITLFFLVYAPIGLLWAVLTMPRVPPHDRQREAE